MQNKYGSSSLKSLSEFESQISHSRSNSGFGTNSNFGTNDSKSDLSFDSKYHGTQNYTSDLKHIYKNYTYHISNFEKHAQKLYDDWVIDIANRNYILQNLDVLIKQMIKIYNENLATSVRSSDDVNNLSNNKLCIDIYNDLAIIDILENNKTNNPFQKIKDKLIKMGKKNGTKSMGEFFKLYFNDIYHSLFDKSCLELFEIYDEVFVPLSIEINKCTKNKRSKILISKCDNGCDSLINNTCTISILLDCISTEICFEGYISVDRLNIKVRTSQICSRHLFIIKSDAKNIIKNQYPQVDDSFINRYMKISNSSCYFVNNSEELAEKIWTDYQTYREMLNKNFNSIMKEFCNSGVKNMYNIINLLLMGNEQNIGTAVLLFNLLKDKKVSGEMLIDIIYHNLSYYAQIKLKKMSKQMKSELHRLKNLTVENVSLEKRLSSMVNMPDNVKSYILEKINEIKSGENSYKLQMAVNGLMQFPWKPIDFKNDYSDIKKSMVKSRKYLQDVAKKLDESVYGHNNSKKVLLELVGKWIQNPNSTGQVIGLVGPPGVGKTLLAKSISSALDIPLSIVGLGGMSDSADLIGHSFTYAGAQYGMIIRQMIKSGNWRSVMFFDEVDKVSKRNDVNEINNTLIHITDPNMNQHFQDRFYSSSIEFDLSGVLIVFSYNDSSKIDPILLDRIKPIEIEPYSVQEKIEIAQKHTIKELCDNIGFDHNKIHFDNKTIQYIIEQYTVEAGVRELKRKLEQILLKLNIDRFYMRGPFQKLMKKEYYSKLSDSQISEEDPTITENNSNHNLAITSYVSHTKSKYEDNLDDEMLDKIFNLNFEDKLEIDTALVHKYLDKPIMMVEKIHKNDLVGVINGLYATSVGIGGIVPIQIFKNFTSDTDDGTNIKLKLTGNQKQIMRESVVCAFTTAVNILNPSIKKDIVKNFVNGFHIHAPDGGTPKDGPSAGCAFTTAFISAILNKKINKNVAMTGEIELTGKISKIGGLYAKLNGAKKAGITCVYICEENRDDYISIKAKSPELFDNTFEIKIINHIIDIVSDPNVIIDISDNDFDDKVLDEYRSKKNLINQ